MGKQQKQENNKVKADHERLKRALEEIREKRQFVLDTIKDSRFSTILKRYENDIDADKEALVGAESGQQSPTARSVTRRLRAALRRRRTSSGNPTRLNPLPTVFCDVFAGVTPTWVAVGGSNSPIVLRISCANLLLFSRSVTSGAMPA